MAIIYSESLKRLARTNKIEEVWMKLDAKKILNLFNKPIKLLTNDECWKIFGEEFKYRKRKMKFEIKTEPREEIITRLELEEGTQNDSIHLMAFDKKGVNQIIMIFKEGKFHRVALDEDESKALGIDYEIINGRCLIMEY